MLRRGCGGLCWVCRMRAEGCALSQMLRVAICPPETGPPEPASAGWCWDSSGGTSSGASPLPALCPLEVLLLLRFRSQLGTELQALLVPGCPSTP